MATSPPGRSSVGMPFHPRCPKRASSRVPGRGPENCRNDLPPLGEIAPVHFAGLVRVEKGESLVALRTSNRAILSA